MCIKKITVETGTLYPEGLDESFLCQITKKFTMYVTPFTTNAKLLRIAGRFCKCEDDQNDLPDRFQVVNDGQLYPLNPKGKLLKVMRYLGNPKTLYLDYAICLPGGFGLDEKNGIRYIMHTDESGHTPHVHARYQGEEISINLRTLKVKNSFKSPKKQKQAIAHVKSHREEYMLKYAMATNGIQVPDDYIEEE